MFRQRLRQAALRLEEVETQLAQPETYDDPALAARLSQEQKELTPLVTAFAGYEKARQDLAGLEELLADPEYRALAILRARLYQLARQEQEQAVAGQRRSQVGTGMRNERIRTYNFPQRRVTDHRIGLTLHKLDNILNGELDELIDALLLARQREEQPKE